MPYFDDLNTVLTWYQNHVGAYDKAKWEQSVEERILHGINHIPTKSAKLASELIDLDLVQGSSFPKAKPKHGLFTVTRHALLRFLFLPLYHDWWSAQTSRKLYILFILLYAAQLFNVVLYLTAPLPPQVLNATAPLIGPNREGFQAPQPPPVPIQTSDILSPLVLMLILTLLHSQIVATQWATGGRSGLGGILLGSKTKSARDQLTKSNTTSNTNATGKNRRNSGGLSSKSLRKARRNASRLPPSRRRSVNLSGLTLTVPPPSPMGEQSSVEILDLGQLAGSLYLKPPPAPRSSVSSSLSPSAIKKVFFQDESGPCNKSWSPSNSDRDEGIPEEIHAGPCDHDHDHHSCNFSMTLEDPIIKKNLAKTMAQFAREENRSSGMDECFYEDVFQAEPQVCGCDLSSCGSQKKNKQSREASGATGRITERRSVLRKRNLSKQSERSTTTPSGSCGECSSNNEESSTDEEDEEEDNVERGSGDSPHIDDDEVRSKSEWTAVTTNSEDDDYVEEEVNNSDDDDAAQEEGNQMNDHPFAWEFQQYSSKTTSPSCASSDKVSCTIWEGQEAKKADLSVLDISALIIAKVERARENSDYLYLGICFSILLAFLPGFWRLNSGFEIDDFDFMKTSHYISEAVALAYGNDLRTRIMISISFGERLSLSLCVFFLLAVAEKTYKQRFLYSKLFSRLTSTRKSKKSGIPHFRLNKVRNIKTWLSVRSYLQRRGPQRSVDTIVSATFIATLILICFLSVELLKDSSRMYYLYNLEVIAWSLCLGIYLMRFMTLGSRISQKYRNLSVIITEQLNLYLKMEQKPHKKDELLVANNVLKLASELLKELEDPFKISSFASNPYFYNLTRLVILSAFSGVLSEILGFKLKLYKIKLK